jgi:Nucleotide-diphospho-sugar transferase
MTYREVLTIIEATGAMGIYHEGYSSVSKKPSTDYLDRPFVDMMWYKAFSVYLVLHMKMNVLFQDVDLVWFRDPFPYFKGYGRGNGTQLLPEGKKLEAFFSDDGQRSLRYSPFYANSGFYYLLANERNEYFAWSIMTDYDAVQVLGSHQNVLTTRLVEELSLTAEKMKILPMDLFPSGVHYHHDWPYMKRMQQGIEHPYVFHM